MIWTIAARELRNLFISPLAWALLVIAQCILAFLFLALIDVYLNQLQARLGAMEQAPGVADLIVAPLYGPSEYALVIQLLFNIRIGADTVLLLLTPLLTMRVVSEERRAQTLSVLFSAPVSMTEIIVGKYLGVLAFVFIAVLMISLMPASLMAGTDFDWGRLASVVLALILLMSAFVAIGIFMSTATSYPTVAAVGTLGLLLMFWLVDWRGAAGDASALADYLSMARHYEALLRGVVAVSDVVYFLLVTAVFLFLSVRRLDALRLRHS